jgi:(2Fe-2S) ferredoxin
LLGISDKPNGRYGLAGLLGAERGELPALGLLVALAFVLATSFVLVQTTADGLFTVQSVRCLGCCSLAPAIMIDREVYGQVTPARLGKIVKQYRKESAND